MSNTGPLDLAKSPIHLPDDGTEPAVVLEGFGFDGPSFEAYIDTHCASGVGHLMMIETSPTSWTTWERHPEGDEIVHILEGAGEFIQDVDGQERRGRIEPGATFVNPKGAWHTADITSPVRAVYLTPCPGTEHKPR
jgi:uncharacterized cupin superfamily protein